MNSQPRPERVAVVVHPTRPIDGPLATLESWAADCDIAIVQIATAGSIERSVAAPGEPRSGDLLLALGGDGTVLAALRASAPVDAPVLGAACGSVGALTAVTADGLGDALDRIWAGDWIPRPLPALAIERASGQSEWAVNDFVAIRHGAGQLVANVSVDDELYVRVAGDGVIVATPLGSSAYSMAAGGPLLAYGASAFVCTPLAMHGGNAPPLVIPSGSALQLQLHPGFAGFEVEIDGQNYAAGDLEYRITLRDDQVTLVAFGGPQLGLTALRERRLVTDSARVLARDSRVTQPAPAAPR
jgi:NAD+ kinase